VTEALLGEGMHLVRAGSALICVEPTDEPGEPVRPIELPSESLRQASPALMRKLLESGARKMRQGIPQRMLVGIEGPAKGCEYQIPDRGLIVGREGDVRVPDEFLSRKHFSLVIDEQGWVRIKDLESRNGTFLNTLPARNTKIHPGDQIRAGQSVFRVEERGGGEKQGRRQKAEGRSKSQSQKPEARRKGEARRAKPEARSQKKSQKQSLFAWRCQDVGGLCLYFCLLPSAFAFSSAF
jgi:hypothetical protein